MPRQSAHNDGSLPISSLAGGELRLVRAIDYLKSNWQRVHTLQDLADDFGIDPANLTRHFRQREGTTPKRFLNGERRKFVMDRVNEGAMLGYEIGAQLGFPDDISFYRWVRREFGIPLRELQANSLVANGDGE